MNFIKSVDVKVGPLFLETLQLTPTRVISINVVMDVTSEQNVDKPNETDEQRIDKICDAIKQKLKLLK